MFKQSAELSIFRFSFKTILQECYFMRIAGYTDHGASLKFDKEVGEKLVFLAHQP